MMCAINIALCTKAAEIYLLGVDMDTDAPENYADNYTPGHGISYQDKVWLGSQFDAYKKYFGHVKNVFNLNEKSKLISFPFKKIDDVLYINKVHQKKIHSELSYAAI